MEDRIDMKSLVFMVATTLFVFAFINILTHVKQRSQSLQKKKDSNVLSKDILSSLKLSQLTDIENYLKKSSGKISELWINTTIDENTGFVINRCYTTGKYIADNAEAWIVECVYGHLHRIPVIPKKNLATQQALSTTVQQPQRIITVQQPILSLCNQKLQYKSCFPRDVDELRQKTQKKSRELLQQESRRRLQKLHVSRQPSLSNYFQNQVELLKEKEVMDAMTSYVLTSEQLLKYGYPIESKLPDCAIINYTPYPTIQQSSESDDSNSVEYSQRKMCTRCSKPFSNYAHTHSCTYHWGKLWDDMTNDITIKYWTCCRKAEIADGCTTAEMHVWTGLQPGLNGPLAGFVHTKPNKDTQKTLRFVAVDCEMCFTEAGLEVVKVTIVDKCGKIVYEKLIKPSNDIVDYNTKFSGITKEDMQKVTDSLGIVQRELLQYISAETILIGHGLESDLRVLRLLHKKIIDTSVVYPHHKGFPYRNSLKILAKRVLKRSIQETTHDPAEDARAAMDLMMAKILLERKIERSTSRTA